MTSVSSSGTQVAPRASVYSLQSQVPQILDEQHSASPQLCQYYNAQVTGIVHVWVNAAEVVVAEAEKQRTPAQVASKPQRPSSSAAVAAAASIATDAAAQKCLVLVQA
jgi:hypothetical protein